LRTSNSGARLQYLKGAQTSARLPSPVNFGNFRREYGDRAGEKSIDIEDECCVHWSSRNVVSTECCLLGWRMGFYYVSHERCWENGREFLDKIKKENVIKIS
jgi:hypothetical protein